MSILFSHSLWNKFGLVHDAKIDSFQNDSLGKDGGALSRQLLTRRSARSSPPAFRNALDCAALRSWDIAWQCPTRRQNARHSPRQGDFLRSGLATCQTVANVSGRRPVDSLRDSKQPLASPGSVMQSKTPWKLVSSGCKKNIIHRLLFKRPIPW